MEVPELCFQTHKHYLIVLLLELKMVLQFIPIVLTNNAYA